MNEDLKKQTLDWMEKRLEVSSEFFLPLKRLLRELEEGVTFPLPAEEEIAGWLAADRRFDLMETPEDLGGYSPGNERRMEELGFFKGPRVGLTSKRPSQREIAEKLEEHIKKLTEALQKAYASRDMAEGSIPDLEDRLLDVMRKVQTFKNSLPLEEEEVTVENQKAE